VPPGILTALQGTAVGQIIEQIEHRSEAGAVAVGLELLKLNGETAINLSRAIDHISALAAKDGQPHDITFASNEGSSGFTIHCNNLPEAEAGPRLKHHCELRKYSVKAARWVGLAIAPGTGRVCFGGMTEYPWEQDPAMDAATAEMVPPQSMSTLMAGLGAENVGKRQKIGRNDPCPCGSGKKYKKCHLRQDH
jgi:hypothetical protein